MRIYRNPDIARLVSTASSDQRVVVRKLLAMRELAEAENRAAAEAPMIDDDGLNADLREIDLALEEIGYRPNSTLAKPNLQ